MNIQNLKLLADLLETFRHLFEEAHEKIESIGPRTSIGHFDEMEFEFARFDRPETMTDVTKVIDFFIRGDQPDYSSSSEIILIAAKIYHGPSGSDEGKIIINVTETKVIIEGGFLGNESYSYINSFELPQTPGDSIKIVKIFIEEVYKFTETLKIG